MTELVLYLSMSVKFQAAMTGVAGSGRSLIGTYKLQQGATREASFAVVDSMDRKQLYHPIVSHIIILFFCWFYILLPGGKTVA